MLLDSLISINYSRISPHLTYFVQNIQFHVSKSYFPSPQNDFNLPRYRYLVLSHP